MSGSLVPWLVAAMTSWVPVEQHRWLEPRAKTEARYVAIAEAIEEASTDPDEDAIPAPDPVEGERAATFELRSRAYTALVLAAVASVESYYRRDVEQCRVAGDGGRIAAWGLFQLARRYDVVCHDRKRTARVALTMIRASIAACTRVAMPERLSLFTQGRCERSKASRDRMRRALAFWHRAPWMPPIEDGGHDDGAAVFLGALAPLRAGASGLPSLFLP